MMSVLAARHVDICLLPEMDINLEKVRDGLRLVGGSLNEGDSFKLCGMQAPARSLFLMSSMSEVP